MYRGTGTPLSEWQQGNPPHASDDYECIALCPEDRAGLHARIAKRLDAMFDQGLVAEVTRLYEREGLNTDLPAIRAVGYRQVWSYLEGEIDLATCREKVLAATRQLAKRQLTWLRAWPDLTWMWTDEAGQLIEGGDPAFDATDANDHGLSTPVDGIWFGRLRELMRNF